MSTGKSYNKIVSALKKRKKGATVADITAVTALPLTVVDELLPKAADEYSGHLQVTQSGEILYTFPNGFSSRYRGIGAVMGKAADGFFRGIKAAGVFLFKVWIMLMLVGYFVLFVAIAVAAVVLSVVAQSRSSGNRRGGANFGPSLFGMMWRIWFVREITRPRYGHYGHAPVTQKKETGLPMHKAVFSFVFGEGDPNKNWEEQKDKAVITYIQANNGVISLPEYMALSGLNSKESEEAILSFCVRFGGSPEVCGTGIVYRFDKLLSGADTKKYSELSPPVKRLKKFSGNTKTKNTWLVVINAVNLIFGSYFLYHSFNTALQITEFTSYLYAFVVVPLQMLEINPLFITSIVLGIVPLVFSIFFWLIPGIRLFMENKQNELIKLSNYKSFCFSKIWASPLNVKPNSIVSYTIPECRPKNLNAASDRVIKELGVYSNPDVEIDSKEHVLYSFKGLESEKRALEQYRKSLDPKRAELGSTVFDSAD